MKIEQVKELITFVQQEIVNLITTKDLLNDDERNKVLRNIDNLLKQTQTEVIDLVDHELSLEYEKAIEDASKSLKAQNVDFKSSLNSQVHKDALAHIANDTMSDLEAAFRTAAFYTGKSINDAVKQVNEQISRGILYGNNRKYIIKQVYDAFAKEGMTSFVTIDNKRLPLDFYAETVTRTKLSQARTQGHVNTFIESGNDLVEVYGHVNTCGECAAYQGRVFSVTGKDPRFTHLDVRDVIPVHPNCRCGVKPYVADFRTEEEISQAQHKSRTFNKELDPRTQKQRQAYEKEQAKKRQENIEKKAYRQMKGVLKDDAPKSLGAYRRMRRGNTSGYQKLKKQLRSIKS